MGLARLLTGITLILLLILPLFHVPAATSEETTPSYRVVEHVEVDADAVKVPLVLDSGDGWSLVLVLARDYGWEPDTLYGLVMNVTSEGVSVLDEDAFRLDGFATSTRLYRASDLGLDTTTPYAGVAVLYKMTYPVDLYPYVKIVLVPVEEEGLLGEPVELVTIETPRPVRVMSVDLPCPGEPVLHASLMVLWEGKSLAKEEDWKASPGFLAVNLSSGEWIFHVYSVNITHYAGNGSYLVEAWGLDPLWAEHAWAFASTMGGLDEDLCTTSSRALVMASGEDWTRVIGLVEPPRSSDLYGGPVTVAWAEINGSTVRVLPGRPGGEAGYVAVRDPGTSEYVVYRVYVGVSVGLNKVISLPGGDGTGLRLFYSRDVPMILYTNTTGSYMIDLEDRLAATMEGSFELGGPMGDYEDDIMVVLVSKAWDLYVIYGARGQGVEVPYPPLPYDQGDTVAYRIAYYEAEEASVYLDVNLTIGVSVRNDKITWYAKEYESGSSESLPVGMISLSPIAWIVDYINSFLAGFGNIDLEHNIIIVEDYQYDQQDESAMNYPCPIYLPGVEGRITGALIDPLLGLIQYNCWYDNSILTLIVAKNNSTSSKVFVIALTGTTIPGVEPPTNPPLPPSSTPGGGATTTTTTAPITTQIPIPGTTTTESTTTPPTTQHTTTGGEHESLPTETGRQPAQPTSTEEGGGVPLPAIIAVVAAVIAVAVVLVVLRARM